VALLREQPRHETVRASRRMAAFAPRPPSLPLLSVSRPKGLHSPDPSVQMWGLRLSGSVQRNPSLLKSLRVMRCSKPGAPSSDSHPLLWLTPTLPLGPVLESPLPLRSGPSLTNPPPHSPTVLSPSLPSPGACAPLPRPSPSPPPPSGHARLTRFHPPSPNTDFSLPHSFLPPLHQGQCQGQGKRASARSSKAALFPPAATEPRRLPVASWASQETERGCEGEPRPATQY